MLFQTFSVFVLFYYLTPTVVRMISVDLESVSRFIKLFGEIYAALYLLFNINNEINNIKVNFRFNYVFIFGTCLFVYLLLYILDKFFPDLVLKFI